MTTTKPKTYWSATLKHAVTVPEEDERTRIDELLAATTDLLAAIQLAGLAPADPRAKEVWDGAVARARAAVNALK